MSETTNQRKEIESNQNTEFKNEILNICEPMCLKIIKEKPEHIVQYMMKYLRNKYNYSSSLMNTEQKKELSQLKRDLQFFHEQEENSFYIESYHKFKKDVKSPEKKGRTVSKQKQRIHPNEIIPSDDEDYNNPEEIDTRLDDINYVKQNASKEIRPDYFEIKNDNQKVEIKYNKKPQEIFEFLKLNLIKSPLFSELPFDILTKCINAMNEVNFKAMNDIVKQGEYNDNFYIILEGELECKMGFTIVKKEGNRTKIEKYDPKLVKVYYPGDYFCELNLLYHMPVRGSVKAITDSILYSLDRKAYKYILNSSYKKKENNQIELFKKIPIFETLIDEEYEKLVKIAKEEIYYKGEIIIKENDYINKLMIIKEGKCTGYKMIDKGKMPIKTKEYKEEDFFGKTALLREELSEESIIASSNIVKFISFDRYIIKNILGSLEHILMRDVDIYEKYFPPIPEYSEHEPIKENTKSLLLSSEGEYNNINIQSIDENKLGIKSNENNDNSNNMNSQNFQSRNTEKKNILPEKINSLSYGFEGMSKKLSKEREEEYESEIKRLKEEVSLLKNKLQIKTYPELINNNINNEEKNQNNSIIDTQQNIIRQENIEKEIYTSDINNNITNKELNTDKIVNSENNNITNNKEMNNNSVNEKLNNDIVNYDLNQQKNNQEETPKKEEINYIINNNEINNMINQENNKSKEIKEENKNNEFEDKGEIVEIINSEVNMNNNNIKEDNLSNKVNISHINEENLNSDIIIPDNNEKINSKPDSNNNSTVGKKINTNNSQTSFKENKLVKSNKFKNLKDLDIDDMNNSKSKRTVTNKSIKNMDNFVIDSVNSKKNKKNNSEVDINKDDSQNNI